MTSLVGGVSPIRSTNDGGPLAGGGFEWDDGLPLTPAQEPALRVPAAPPKPAKPSPFSRFTVSPAPASRFSITHVSDSDSGSVGGEAAVGLAGGDTESGQW